MYFLQPFNAPSYKDEQKPDEVFFWLKERDDALDRALRLYGGSDAEAVFSSTPTRFTALWTVRSSSSPSAFWSTSC